MVILAAVVLERQPRLLLPKWGFYCTVPHAIINLAGETLYSLYLVCDIFLVEYSWTMLSLRHLRIEIDTSLSVLFVSPRPLGCRHHFSSTRPERSWCDKQNHQFGINSFLFKRLFQRLILVLNCNNHKPETWMKITQDLKPSWSSTLLH
jgi:hypothetical protein